MQLIKLRKCPRIHGLHYSPDGRRLVALGGSETHFIDASVWFDPATGHTTQRLDFLAQCYALAPDCSRLAIGWSGFGKSDLADLFRWCQVSADGPGPWQRLAGPWLTANAQHRRNDPGVNPSGMAFSQESTTLFVGYNCRVRADFYTQHLAEYRFDQQGPAEASATELPLEVPLTVMECGPRGELATSGGLDRYPVVWMQQPGSPFAKWFEPRGTVTRRLRFAPHRPLLAVANGQHIFLLAPGQSESVATLTGYPKQVNDIAFTADGSRLLTAGHDGAIRIWDTATGAAGPVFDWDIGPLTAVAIAPDGLTAAAAGSKARVVVWDLDS
ncbi:MAG TPA: WD40 repeat domain-containing protein [Gemmataceae bacterium]|nr:WD40 repeat domain-containing protein [Gemmataceae bacterium]